MDRSLSDILLNNGSSKKMRPNARRILSRLTIVDSVRNWKMRELFSEPKVLRMPTSLALSIERAVERLMKLITANININPASAITPYRVGLCAFRISSWEYEASKCISDKDSRCISGGEAINAVYGGTEAFAGGEDTDAAGYTQGACDDCVASNGHVDPGTATWLMKQANAAWKRH